MRFVTASAGAWGRRMAVLAVLEAVFVSHAATKPHVELTSGHVSVRVAPWPQGLRILCDGVEISRHSELVITTPNWATHYYVGPSDEAVSTATVTREADVQSLRLEHRGKDGSFEGTETLALHADGHIEHTLEGRFLKEESKALIQWRIGALNPAILLGQPFSADLRTGVKTMDTVPATPRTGEVNERRLAKGFLALNVNTRIGPLQIEVKSPQDLIVYDYRKDRWANPADPYFWFGDLGSFVDAGQSFRYHMVYHVPPARSSAKDNTQQFQTQIQTRSDAQTYAQSDSPTVIPRPKQARYLRKMCDITGWVYGPLSTTNVMIDGPESARKMMAALRTWARQQFPAAGKGFELPEEAKIPRLVARMATSSWGRPAEAYELDVSPGGIRVLSADAAGFRHALQTLKQLVTLDTDNHLVVRCAEIRDWPSLSFRGVHLFTGGQGPQIHIKLIRNVIGALKMNHLVLESEYIKWDSHPEIHHPEYGMPKADVREVLEVCEELGIKVIPLIASLGHCQWMFTNDQNLDLAEDPEAKWAHCVTNPKTYDFLFEIYDEALELFKPDSLHIGHDEFTQRGRVPFRPESRKYTVEQLLQMDTVRLRDWLAEHGVRTMMWGDMLLGPGEGPDACHAASADMAAALRKEWPTGITITDWHYAVDSPEKFVNLDKFRSAGLPTIAATWYRPRNIVNFATAAYEKKSQGLLQTTWAGYSLDPESFAREIHQYAAYVLAAEVAWNADTPPDADTYPARTYFFELMGMSALQPANRPGWTADLSAAYNVPLAAANAQSWFGLGPERDLSRVPGGTVRMNGVSFQLGRSDDSSTPSAIVLRSKLTPAPELPTQVEIAIGAAAPRLIFLHTTSFACERDALVGVYELHYDDGTMATIDLVYGRNIFAYTDAGVAAEAPSLWTGRTPGGEAVALHGLVWDHPHPDKTIQTLTIRSGNAAGSLIVLGLTGLNDPAPGK